MRDLFNLHQPTVAETDFDRRFTPRPYQLEAKSNFFRLANEGNEGVLIRLNTGGGKTFLGSWIANEWNARSDNHYTIVFAHERQLVSQFAEEIQDLLGVRVGIEMADLSVRFGTRDCPRIIVASRATLMENKEGNSRLYKFDNKLNWLQIYDECHRWSYRLKSCRHIVDWFAENPKSCRLGLTATPERGDGVTLGRLFPSIALDYRMYDINGGPSAVNDGWAVPYDQRFIEVAGVDFANLKEVAGDFRDDELDEILSQKEQLDSLIKPMLDLVGSKRTIIFNPGVPMSRAVSEAINAERKYRIDNGIDCPFGLADALDGSADEVTRKRTFQAHQRGEIQFLSVCGLCREGYNDPGIEAVAIFRPTKSRSLAEQMKGRGCRPLKGIVDGLGSTEERLEAIASSAKPNCMIIDLVGVSGLGDVASTAQLMAEGKPDEVVKRANENAKKKQTDQPDETIDMQEEIRKAEREISEEAKAKEQLLKAEAKARAEKEAKLRTEVRYHEQKVGSGSYAPEVKQKRHREGIMPFGKFAGKRIADLPEFYLKYGIEKFDGGIVDQFQEVLDRRQQFKPKPDGPANSNQRKVLQRHGFDPNVTFAEAGRIIKEEINPQLAGSK